MQSEHKTSFLTIGTRGSPLALAQAEEVRDHLAAAHGVEEGEIAIRRISTAGDRSQPENRPLREIGGKGTFSKEIEQALAAGEIDVAVHSAKDMAAVLPEGLIMPFFLAREDVRDAFISLTARSVDELPEGARLGTSSLRRAAQMRHHRPDLEVIEFRGNVGTRLQKLADGVADATLLAAAGLRRLELAKHVKSYLDPQHFPTAPGQGAIGLELREDDARTFDLLQPLNDPDTADTVRGERAYLARLDGSCRTPIGVISTLMRSTLTLRGQVLSPDGQRMYEAEVAGDIADAETIGTALGEEIIDRAGTDFMDEIRKG